MNLDQMLEKYSKVPDPYIDPQKISIVASAAREAFLSQEEKRVLSYGGFLRVQLKVLQKKWWIFQLFLLAGVWLIYPLMDDFLYGRRSLGIAATLFIILIIPEMWKNRSGNTLEIEGAAFYSLREIYAARILLFAIADVLMITVFMAAASFYMSLGMADLLIQFLLPMTITACICFGFLCSPGLFGQSAAVGMSLIWSVIWWFIVLNENIYQAISFPLWVGIFCAATALLGTFVFRLIGSFGRIWEVNLGGTESK